MSVGGATDLVVVVVVVVIVVVVVRRACVSVGWRWVSEMWWMAWVYAAAREDKGGRGIVVYGTDGVW